MTIVYLAFSSKGQLSTLLRLEMIGVSPARQGTRPFPPWEWNEKTSQLRFEVPWSPRPSPSRPIQASPENLAIFWGRAPCPLLSRR